MSDWFETLPTLLDRVWQTLSRGVADANHPARLPTFATLSPDGWPEARTVVLRAADRTAGTLEIHTDLYSGKIDSLRRTPRAALHVWIPKQDLQIRIQAEVTIAQGEAVQATWQRVPDPSRQSYGVTPPPGTPIPDALDYEKSPDPASFAVLTCRAARIDAVHLGERHRRAAWSRDDDWRGCWLSP